MTRFLSFIAVLVVAVALSVALDRYLLKDEAKMVGNVENVTRKVEVNASTIALLIGLEDTSVAVIATPAIATNTHRPLHSDIPAVQTNDTDKSTDAIRDEASSERTALCPELHKAIQYVAELPTPPPALNVSILQLVGSWNDNYTSGVMQTVFEHNAEMVATQFGFGSKAVTNLTECMSRIETSHPAFCKILAVREYCIESTFDLVWFLDGDVVLMNPHIRIDFLWTYYQQYYSYGEQLDMLFATDWLGLNSGSFVVNCTSPSALKLLEYWDIFAPRVNRWKKVWNAMLEQNGIQWLVQDENWRRTYPRHKRDNKLLRSSSEEEQHMFSVPELRKRVAVVNQTCQVATFPVDFWCDAQQKRHFYEHKGPVWWEVGHAAVHTAGTRDAARRLPYLLERVRESSPFLVVGSNQQDAPPPDMQATARAYLDKFGGIKSTNPLASLKVQQCKQEQRQADQEAKERLKAKLNKTGAL